MAPFPFAMLTYSGLKDPTARSFYAHGRRLDPSLSPPEVDSGSLSSSTWFTVLTPSARREVGLRAGQPVSAWGKSVRRVKFVG